ncbi:hypothetical protein ACFC6L_05825 [Kitasatospora phosalacinea]|uniref:hypothetical protein n=1 Tax=Kitasatospora phosalacinea TaxID=2065 RepID=UPI0035D6EC94
MSLSAPTATRGGPVRWSVAGAAGLVYGCLLVVPFVLVVVFARNYPLHALGWTDGEPTDNDGVLPWLVLLVPLLLLAVAGWVLLGLLGRRALGLPRRQWHRVRAGLAVLPSAVLLLGSLLRSVF